MPTSRKTTARSKSLSQRQLANLALVYDLLDEHAAGTHSLYVRDGDAKLRQQVARTISTETVKRDQMQRLVLRDPWAVAAGVKQALRAHEPVTGYDTYRTFLESSDPEHLRAACGALSPPMARALQQLCNHLRRVPDKSKLLEAMGSVVLRSRTGDAEKNDVESHILEALLSLPWNPDTSSQVPQERDDAADEYRESIKFLDEHLLLCSIEVQWHEQDAPRDESALADAFSHSGVVKAVVNYKRNKGFVSFKDAASVRNAMSSYDGRWTTKQLNPPETIQKKHAIRRLRQQIKPIAFERSDGSLAATDKDLASVRSLTPSIHDRILKVTWGNSSQLQPTRAALTDVFSKFGEISKCGTQNDQSALIMFASKDSAVAAESEYDGPWVVRRLRGIGNFFDQDACEKPTDQYSSSVRERCILLSRNTNDEKHQLSLERAVQSLIETLDIMVIETIVREQTAILLFKTKEDARSAAARICNESSHFSATCLDATTRLEAPAESRRLLPEAPEPPSARAVHRSSGQVDVPTSIERLEEQRGIPSHESSAKTSPPRRNLGTTFEEVKDVRVHAQHAPTYSSRRKDANWLPPSKIGSSPAISSKKPEATTPDSGEAPAALAMQTKLIKALEAKVDVMKGDVAVIRARTQSKGNDSSSNAAWRDLFLHSSRQIDQTRYLYLSSYTGPVDSFRRDYRRTSPSRVFQPQDPELREWWDSVTEPSLHQRRIAECYYNRELKL